MAKATYAKNFRFFRTFRVRKKEETDLSERIYWFNFLIIYFQTPTQVVFSCFRLLKKQDKTNKNI